MNLNLLDYKYNFPRTIFVPELNEAETRKQFNKIREELDEVYVAWHMWNKESLLEELLDVVQAVETLLRAFPRGDLKEAREKVRLKNSVRGYYDV